MWKKGIRGRLDSCGDVDILNDVLSSWHYSSRLCSFLDLSVFERYSVPTSFFSLLMSINLDIYNDRCSLRL